MSASKKEEIENEQLQIEMSSPKKKAEKAPKVKKEEKTVDKKDKKETIDILYSFFNCRKNQKK